MTIRTSLLALALFFALAKAVTEIKIVGDPLTKSKFPNNIQKLKSLQEFVTLVNDNNLNVSLIASSATNYKKGNPKEVSAITFTFPVNSVSVSANTLNKENFEPLLRAASKEKLTVAGTEAINNQLTVYTNNPEGIAVTKALKIFSGIKNGKTGFVFDEDDYVAQYTYISEGDDGQNQTTRVLVGDLQDIEVVGQENLSEDEVNKIKKVLVQNYFTYSEGYVARTTYEILTKEIPLPDGNSWDVAYEVDEHNYLDSNKWVQFRILKDNFFVYSVY